MRKIVNLSLRKRVRIKTNTVLLSIFLSVYSGVLPAQQAAPVDCQSQGKVTQSCDSSSKGWFILMLMNTLKESTTQAMATQSNSLLNNWFGWLFGQATIKPSQQQIGNSLTGNTTPPQQQLQNIGAAAPDVPVTVAQQVQGIEEALATPVLGIQAVFLQGPEVNSPPHPINGVADIKSQEGQPLTFEVFNNDVYALRVTPSTPGIVRLTSIDGLKTEVLDLVAVLPGRVNRFPVEGGGGYVVDTNVGTETLRLEFEACAPESLRNEPVMQSFAGKLKKCSLQFGQESTMQVAGKSAINNAAPPVVSKGMTRTQPRNENKVGFLSADKGYLPGNVITYDIAVKHSFGRAP